MVNTKHFTGGEGSIWIQPDGPATSMTFLGCHEVASIDEPLGDYTPFFCPDPSRPNAWVTAGETTSPPDAVTASILEDVTDALSTLERQKCPFALYINMFACGRRDVFTNYRRTFIFDVQRLTNRSYDNVALRDSNERTTVTHDVSAAPPLIRIVDVSVLEQAVPDATAAPE